VTFLHPEFLLWMTLPVGILFYFWLTQQPHQHDYFTPRAWEMLCVKESTLSLQGRNILFLLASLLLILALSEPVIEEKKIPLSPQPLTIALNISLRPVGEFDQLKHKALTLIDASDTPISLIAYDTHLYRITPSSEDKETLKILIHHLSPSVMHDSHTDPTVLERLPRPWIEVSSTAPLNSEEQKILHPKKEEVFYFPLFYLPLGLALLLIGLGLISMSKRESVTLGMIALLVILTPPKAEAGMMDFRLLRDAHHAYNHQNYGRSATLFLTYQRLHDSPQVRYNLANAYFKSGNYPQAAYWYAQVHPTDPQLAQWVAWNQRQLPHPQKRVPTNTPTPKRITNKHQKRAISSHETRGETSLFLYQ
jgi:hypothetical protein